MRFFSLIVILALCVSCQHAPKTVFYKPLNARSKTIAFPSNSYTTAPTYKSSVGMGFTNAVKNRLRENGWTIVVQGVTGRAGATAGINSGAEYTMLGYETPRETASLPVILLGGLAGAVISDCFRDNSSVNFTLVENKTGEEIMTFSGQVNWTTDAVKFADEINAHAN